MAGETWRHELQPLGVRTITLITFAVKTKALNNCQLVELSETSNYFEIRDFIRDLADGRVQANAITSRQYAIKVVGQVEKGTVGTVWIGTDAFLGRLAWLLSPQSVFDIIVQSVVSSSKEMAKAEQRRKA